MENDEVREQIAKIIWMDGGDNDSGWEFHDKTPELAQADQILAIDTITIVDQEAELPYLELQGLLDDYGKHIDEGKDWGIGSEAQGEAVSLIIDLFKAGWVKVVTDGK